MRLNRSYPNDTSVEISLLVPDDEFTILRDLRLDWTIVSEAQNGFKIYLHQLLERNGYRFVAEDPQALLLLEANITQKLTTVADQVEYQMRSNSLKPVVKKRAEQIKPLQKQGYIALPKKVG